MEMAAARGHKAKVEIDDSTRELLEEQVTVQDRKQRLRQIHENRRSLDERAFYPAHPPRKESPAYKKAHDHLTKQLDLPCLICGIKYSILKDPAKRADLKLNPYGAKAMETHHHVIEWALAEAIDPDKFNRNVLPHLQARHPETYPKDRKMSAQDVKDWVDHSEDNLWVLCDIHHRHKWLGIHMISDPIWGPQDLLSDDFVAAMDEAFKNDTGADTKKTSRRAARTGAKAPSPQRKARPRKPAAR
jgi:hypothetical protein